MIGMGGGAVAYPWTLCFAETLVAVNVNEVRGHFSIPQLQHGLTFGLWCADRAAGNATITLRFAWQDADADLSVIGIDFPQINLTGQSFVRSVVFADGSAAPGTDGSSPSMLPPRCSVHMQNGVAATLDYAVFMACVGLF